MKEKNGKRTGISDNELFDKEQELSKKSLKKKYTKGFFDELSAGNTINYFCFCPKIDYQKFLLQLLL